jgi:predicted signal transduction protein with EAL and GGDEF domain
VGVSIGVASAPDDGLTSRDLMHGADVAMYKAKRTGSAIERYDNCVRGPQRGRINLLSDLGEALRRHELHVHFQPQVRVVGRRGRHRRGPRAMASPEHGPSRRASSSASPSRPT